MNDSIKLIILLTSIILLSYVFISSTSTKKNNTYATIEYFEEDEMAASATNQPGPILKEATADDYEARGLSSNLPGPPPLKRVQKEYIYGKKAALGTVGSTQGSFEYEAATNTLLLKKSILANGANTLQQSNGTVLAVPEPRLCFEDSSDGVNKNRICYNLAKFKEYDQTVLDVRTIKTDIAKINSEIKDLQDKDSILANEISGLDTRFSASNIALSTDIGRLRQDYEEKAKNVDKELRTHAKRIDKLFDEHIPAIQKDIKGNTNRLLNLEKQIFDYDKARRAINDLRFKDVEKYFNVYNSTKCIFYYDDRNSAICIPVVESTTDPKNNEYNNILKGFNDIKKDYDGLKNNKTDIGVATLVDNFKKWYEELDDYMDDFKKKDLKDSTEIDLTIYKNRNKLTKLLNRYSKDDEKYTAPTFTTLPELPSTGGAAGGGRKEDREKGKGRDIDDLNKKQQKVIDDLRIELNKGGLIPTEEDILRKLNNPGFKIDQRDIKQIKKLIENGITTQELTTLSAGLFGTRPSGGGGGAGNLKNLADDLVTKGLTDIKSSDLSDLKKKQIENIKNLLEGGLTKDEKEKIQKMIYKGSDGSSPGPGNRGNKPTVDGATTPPTKTITQQKEDELKARLQSSQLGKDLSAKLPDDLTKQQYNQINKALKSGNELTNKEVKKLETLFSPTPGISGRTNDGTGGRTNDGTVGRTNDGTVDRTDIRTLATSLASAPTVPTVSNLQSQIANIVPGKAKQDKKIAKKIETILKSNVDDAQQQKQIQKVLTKAATTTVQPFVNGPGSNIPAGSTPEGTNRVSTFSSRTTTPLPAVTAQPSLQTLKDQKEAAQKALDDAKTAREAAKEIEDRKARIAAAQKAKEEAAAAAAAREAAARALEEAKKVQAAQAAARNTSPLVTAAPAAAAPPFVPAQQEGNTLTAKQQQKLSKAEASGNTEKADRIKNRGTKEKFTNYDSIQNFPMAYSPYQSDMMSSYFYY